MPAKKDVPAEEVASGEDEIKEDAPKKTVTTKRGRGRPKKKNTYHLGLKAWHEQRRAEKESQD